MFPLPSLCLRNQLEQGHNARIQKQNIKTKKQNEKQEHALVLFLNWHGNDLSPQPRLIFTPNPLLIWVKACHKSWVSGKATKESFAKNAPNLLKCIDLDDVGAAKPQTTSK